VVGGGVRGVRGQRGDGWDMVWYSSARGMVGRVCGVGDGQGDADDRDTVCTAAHAVMGLFGCSIYWISRCEVHSLFVSKFTALISDFAACS